MSFRRHIIDDIDRWKNNETPCRYTLFVNEFTLLFGNQNP